MSSWSDYVIAAAGTDNQSEIARELGISQSTVNRWFAGAEPTVSSVVMVANKYGLDYTDAFLAAASGGGSMRLMRPVGVRRATAKQPRKARKRHTER